MRPTSTSLNDSASRARPSRTLARTQAQAARQDKPTNEVHVTFQSCTGKKLVGTLREVCLGCYQPLLDMAQPSKKAVVLCHGFASHRNGFHYPSMAEALAQHQLASLRFDFSGNGDSEGLFEFGNYVAEARDILAAVTFLRSQGLDVTGLVGHSKGGDAVLVYASMFDDIPYVVNVAGRFDMHAGITQRFGEDIHERLARDKQIAQKTTRDDGVPIEWTLTKWSLQDRLELDMQQVASRIKLSDVLTIHGTHDQVIPYEDAKQWSKHIANHELKPIEGADHSFLQRVHSDAMIQATVEHCGGRS